MTLAEEIVQALQQAADAGEVGELFVLYRPAAGGDWCAGVATDDLAHLTEVARQTLDVAADPGDADETRH